MNEDTEFMKEVLETIAKYFGTSTNVVIDFEHNKIKIGEENIESGKN